MHPGQRIGIDARYLSHGLVGGVQTYLRNLVEALDGSETGQYFTLWTDAKAPFDLSPASQFDIRVLPWSSGITSVRNDLRIGSAMVRSGATIVHFPANYGFAPPGIPTVVTIHDAINLLPLQQIWASHATDLRTRTMMTYLHFMTRASVRRNPVIVTVSEFSRAQILKHAPIRPTTVHVIPSAPDEAFRILPSHDVNACRQELGVREHVLLADAIKNPLCVLRSYNGLSVEVRARTSLVFFSRREPIPEVRVAADRGECLLLVRPTQQELVRLYNLADLFIFPSWYEGFGLPALEAMVCGTPVIGSDRGSLPEVIGEGGIIVDAEDDAMISREISSLLTTAGRLEKLREDALRRASNFSWKHTAREVAALYNVAASRTSQQYPPRPDFVYQ